MITINNTMHVHHCNLNSKMASSVVATATLPAAPAIAFTFAGSSVLLARVSYGLEGSDDVAVDAVRCHTINRLSLPADTICSSGPINATSAIEYVCLLKRACVPFCSSVTITLPSPRPDTAWRPDCVRAARASSAMADRARDRTQCVDARRVQHRGRRRRLCPRDGSEVKRLERRSL